MSTIVFLHGAPGRASLWGSLVSRAPAGTQCAAFDLLEHGDAPDSPASGVDDIVEAVVRRVADFSWPVTLVGHSFGAWVAGRAIPRLPHVERFVALAGIPGLGADLAARSAGLAAALESGQLSLAAGAAIAVDLWLPSAGRTAEQVALITDLIAGDRVLRRHERLADPERRVAPYLVPSVSVHNRGDRAAPVALGREFAQLGAESRWMELDGDGHDPQWSHPAEVAAVVFGE